MVVWLAKFFTVLNSIFTSLSYYKISDLHLVPEDLYKKGFYKELCKKFFENIIDLIMQNSAYKQKMVICASIKAVKIKLLAANYKVV